MTDGQAQQLAKAVATVEHGEPVKSPLKRIDAGEMTLEELLQEVTQEKVS